MNWQNNFSKLSSFTRRFILVFIMVTLMMVPGAVKPRPAEAVGVVAIVGIATTVASLLDYGYKIFKTSQGATSVKINQPDWRIYSCMSWCKMA